MLRTSGFFHGRAAFPERRLRFVFWSKTATILRIGAVSSVVRSFLPDTIRNSVFRGSCFLGRFDPEHTNPHVPEMGCGILSSTLCDCAVADNCLIANTSILSGYHVGRDSTILDCGRVLYKGITDSWLNTDICPGNETGGREFPLLPAIPMERAAAACMGEGRAAVVGEMQSCRETCLNDLQDRSGMIGDGCCITGTSLIRNTLIWPGSIVDNCVALNGALVISRANSVTRIQDGAVVRSSVLRPGVVVDTGSIVLNSYLAECVHVEKNAKITDSFCGPGCGLGEGEVTSSLLGPHVAMHHQSLLIAALWPSGRGNIGYGANIGSNHTGRAPDQECLIGEGCFFGLGSSVKYPADLGSAPHTVIASAVVLPPVRFSFPLSLIMQDKGELCFKPGWLWGASAFTLLRNRDKIARRGGGNAPLFTETTVQCIVRALRLLEDAVLPSGMMLEEKDRELGRQSYHQAYRYALLEYAYIFKDSAAVENLYDPDTAAATGLFREQLTDPEMLKKMYVLEQQELLQRAEKSRKRDWLRGNAVLKGLYAEAHSASDPLLERLQRELDAIV